MLTITEVLEQAKIDLAKAEQREARAREALEAAAVEKSRLTNFLSVLTQYGGLPAVKLSTAAPSKGARESRQGTAAVEVISDRGAPMLVDPLADAIEQKGVEIGGGAKRNSYLASYLSKDPRLKFLRGKGWWVIALGDLAEHDGQPSEDTEPPTDRADEGSSVAGIRVNGPADREAGTTLLEPPAYRMGGGGT